MLVREVINRAYYLSGYAARKFETVDGEDITDGLNYFNEVVEEKAIGGNLIPYFTHDTFNSVVGQEVYFVENLVSCVVLTFNIDTVRFTLQKVDTQRYFNIMRANNITSLPYEYYVERQDGGSNIYLYFLPSDIWEFQITGIYKLTTDDLDTELNSTLDMFYQNYILWSSARKIAMYNSVPWTPDKEKEYLKYETMIESMRTKDMTLKKLSPFVKSTNINYAMAYFKTAWFP